MIFYLRMYTKKTIGYFPKGHEESSNLWAHQEKYLMHPNYISFSFLVFLIDKINNIQVLELAYVAKPS